MTAAAAAERVLLATLDVVLCALVDRPANVRVFEAVGGLGVVVAVLKDRACAEAVRLVSHVEKLAGLPSADVGSRLMVGTR